MNADKILVLGNSMTLSGGIWCGASASKPENDYVHRLASMIEKRTGKKLVLKPMGPENKQSDGTYVAGDANVVNVADVFERAYATYPGSGRLKKQIDWKADIVILQFGENVPRKDFDAKTFTAAFKQLVKELKESSNPQIVVVSHVLGRNPTMDNIKKRIVAEDPSRRVFVDLSHIHKDPTNIGRVAHPNDKGMKLMAEGIFGVLEKQL